MGGKKRSGVAAKKNQLVVAGKSDDDALLRDFILVKEQTTSKTPLLKNGTAKSSKQLVEVPVVQNGHIGTSARRSQRLQKGTTSTQHVIQPQFGQVEVLLGGGQGSGGAGEQNFRHVERRGSVDIDRLSNHAEERQILIDGRAAGQGFTVDELVRAAEHRIKDKADKYKILYAEAMEQVQKTNREKNEIEKKYECATAKQEGFELGQQSICMVLDKIKDAIIYSTMARQGETLLGLPAIANGGDTTKQSPQSDPPAANRNNGSSTVKLGLPTESKSQAAKRKRLVNC